MIAIDAELRMRFQDGHDYFNEVERVELNAFRAA
jgi:hypothetical protein